ncbi:MAG TPA: crosslink repair DNA glycosylase YcaQ family protein [Opitutaceae bacterium]
MLQIIRVPTTAPLSVSAEAARRFQLRALGLVTPHASIADALAHHGYVQIDPINICGRMQDHILRNRVQGYNEGDLMRYLHGADDTPLPATVRGAFEHHLPSTGILVALERTAWPHLLAAMRARTRRAGAWSGRLSPREKELAARILAEIATRGPVGSDVVADERRARKVWGSATLVKSTMQKLFFHGRLLIAGRDRGRRLYDLPERVLPASVLTAAEPDADETQRWEILLRLRQRRLVSLKRGEHAYVEDLVQPVKIGDHPTLHILKTDLPLLISAIENPKSRIEKESAVRLLAPLDPLIYDRVLTRRLWDFDYTWEVYTPPAKRKRGYYALPALAGDALVGHVDPKAHREHGRLEVVGRRLRRGHQVTEAVRALAHFLGLR